MIEQDALAEDKPTVIYYTPKQRVFRGIRGLTQHINNTSDLNEIRPLILDRLEKLASWESELCNADPEEEELERQYPIPGVSYS
ncbi:hypothetical protein [Aeromonas enteropelogenes]|uniref:hypothetical protein n=1 Tax=Aeromonas enteropelogenes TaxID=29489 RepID=UPI003BA35B56